MSHSCGSHTPNFDDLDKRYMRILVVVILINATMVGVEMIAGHLAKSQALKSDALDFLADTLTYAISLAVIGAEQKIRSRAALLKGASLFIMGSYVFISTIYKMLYPQIPTAEIMGGIGILALFANVISVILLARYKDGDANITSVWLCSRNDAIGNIIVMIASVIVFYTQSPWPDLIVAFIMSGLFLHSSRLILNQAQRELSSVT